MQRLPPRPRTLNEVIERLDKLDAESYAFEERLGRLAGEVGTLQEEIRAKSTKMVLRGPPPLPVMRDPESSVHDFDEDLVRLRESLRATAKSDSVRARKLAIEARKTAERDDKAARWDKLVQTGWRVFVGVMVGVLVTIILYRLGVGTR